MAFGNKETALLFKIKGDSSDAERSIKSVDGKIDGLTGKMGISTAEIAKFGAAFSAVAGPATAALGAVAAGFTAAAAAGAVLFSLAKDAADFGSAIFDASTKTGLAAETMSALAYAANQSGSSLEQVSGAVSKFSKLVGDAATGSKEAAEKLKRLGIDPQEAIADLDGALEKVFKRIADAPPGVLQTKAAVDAFGKSGADIIPVIESFDGDLGKLIETAKNLGITLDDEAAKAADEFDDSLDDLSAATKGLTYTFAREFLPTITSVMRDITNLITQNKSAFQTWGVVIRNVLEGLRAVYTWFTSGAGQYVLQAIGAVMRYVTPKSIRIAAGQVAQVATVDASGSGTFIPGGDTDADGKTPRAPVGGGGFGGGGGGGGRTGGGSRNAVSDIERIKAQYQAALSRLDPGLYNAIAAMAKQYGIPEALAFAQIWSESSFKTGAMSNQGAAGLTQMLPETASRVLGYKVSGSDLQKNPNIALTGWAKHMSELARKYGSWDIAVIAYHQGEGTVDKWLAGKGQIGPKGKSYAAKVKALQGIDDPIASRDKVEDKAAAEAERAEAKRIADLKESSKKQLDLLRAYYDTELALLKEKLENGDILNSEYEQKAGEIRAQELEYQREALEELANDEKASAEVRTQALYDIALLDEKITQQRITNSAAVKKALEEEVSAQDQVRPAIGETIELIQTAGGVGADPAGGTETPGIFDSWTNSWKKFFGMISEQGPKLGSILGDVAGMLQGAFSGFAQGIGSVVENWVLLGETGPGVMRKILAQALASLAAEAAMRAIFELAMGFASLFFNPAEAAAHFTAAAIFGTIAVGAGLAGRAIAGDSFKQKSAATAATGSNTQTSRSGSGGAYSGQETMTVNGGRNASAGNGGVIVIKDKSGMFDRLFEWAWDSNGPMRQRLIQEFGK